MGFCTHSMPSPKIPSNSNTGPSPDCANISPFCNGANDVFSTNYTKISCFNFLSVFLLVPSYFVQCPDLLGLEEHRRSGGSGRVCGPEGLDPGTEQAVAGIFQRKDPLAIAAQGNENPGQKYVGHSCRMPCLHQSSYLASEDEWVGGKGGRSVVLPCVGGGVGWGKGGWPVVLPCIVGGGVYISGILH